MTVRLDTFQRVAEATGPRDANLVAAQTAGAMVEMGCFAQEVTVYGSAYYEEGHRRYMLSADEAKIADFVQGAQYAHLLPTPLSQLSLAVVIPAGCAELVSRAAKKRLARQLEASYPPEYFELAAGLLAVTPDTSAQSWLEAMQDALEGVFEEDRLQLFEGLLHLAYLKKNVSERTYHQFNEWLERVRREMADDACPRERFAKTFYGAVYFKADGSRALDINVCREVIYQHQLERQKENIPMTPLASKTYWYGYEQTVQELRVQFADHLARLFDETYLSAWRTLTNLPSAIPPEAWREAQAQSSRDFGDPAQKALASLGRRLGLA